jgi:hypothetical protein
LYTLYKICFLIIHAVAVEALRRRTASRRTLIPHAIDGGGDGGDAVAEEPARVATALVATALVARVIAYDADAELAEASELTAAAAEVMVDAWAVAAAREVTVDDTATQAAELATEASGLVYQPTGLGWYASSLLVAMAEAMTAWAAVADLGAVDRPSSTSR